MTAMTQSERSTAMTDKQLAGMTRYGRKVTFLTPDLDDDITGYVIGFDDECVRVAVVVPATEGGESKVVVKLRNRSYIAGYDADDANQMKSEPCVRELEFMIAPFRAHVMNRYFPDRRSS